MRNENIARRYAAALYALADEDGSVESTLEQLDAFNATLGKDPAVAEFFASPVVPRDVKARIIAAALSGKASELIVNFLILLVKKRREAIVGDVARAMHVLLDAAENVARARVIAARPLRPDEVARLSERLSQRYHADVLSEHLVDADLLGGLTIQVGDRYVDASIAGRLEELRRHLLAAGDVLGAASRNGQTH